MRIALVREVSRQIGRCELTHLPRTPIDLDLARAQHRAYARALERLGCRVVALPEEPDLPDSVFVEDVAIVLDEIAIVTRPGAASRRAETASIAEALARWRSVAVVEPPGTIDGGDVLVIGRRIFAGLSGRTDAAGIDALRDVVAPLGYAVSPVAVRGCLHLKSAVTAAGAQRVLLNPEWVRPGAFDGLEVIEVDPGEPHAANGLLVGESLLCPAAFPRTRRRLEERGIAVTAVDLSELQKAEGAVTCCSLVFETSPGERPPG